MAEGRFSVKFDGKETKLEKLKLGTATVFQQ